jgi:hypothetical protein
MCSSEKSDSLQTTRRFNSEYLVVQLPHNFLKFLTGILTLFRDCKLFWALTNAIIFVSVNATSGTAAENST